MRDSVAAASTAFTTRFEGKTTWMYLDVKCLVTTGLGNLIDPIDAALSLPWRRPGGELATRTEIADEWRAVKARRDLSQRGGGVFARITKLRLTDGAIQELVRRRMQSNESILRKRFPEYDDWPADAQLGVLSMAWAAGASFVAPRFTSAALERDFVTMADECRMQEKGNPGLVPRNVANRILFTNAAEVVATGLDPDRLYWPDMLGGQPDGAA